MTSSNGNIFPLQALCKGNPSVTGGFPSQRPVTWSFDVFFEQTFVQTIETPVIWAAIALIMTSLQRLFLIAESFFNKDGPTIISANLYITQVLLPIIFLLK